MLQVCGGKVFQITINMKLNIYTTCSCVVQDTISATSDTNIAELCALELDVKPWEKGSIL